MFPATSNKRDEQENGRDKQYFLQVAGWCHGYLYSLFRKPDGQMKIRTCQ